MDQPTDLSTVVIAIDGPSGAGKSTVSRGVAEALDLRYLDTGATYRALTWWFLQSGMDPYDAPGLTELVVGGKLPEMVVTTDPRCPGIAVDGMDAEPAIRGVEVTQAVSPVSAVAEIRAYLVGLQRELIGAGGIVVEGRDIGTVVAPEAAVKIFLTADAQARAQRRAAEATTTTDTAGTLADITRRDSYDSTRAVSPLVKADDAWEVDATSHDADEVRRIVLGIIARETGELSAQGSDQAPDRRGGSGGAADQSGKNGSAGFRPGDTDDIVMLRSVLAPRRLPA